MLLSIIRKEGGGRLVVFYNVYAHERRDCKFCVWNRVLTAYFFMITLHLANHSHFRMLTSHDGRARRLQESSSNLIKARDARRHASSTHLIRSASSLHPIIVRYSHPLVHYAPVPPPAHKRAYKADGHIADFKLIKAI